MSSNELPDLNLLYTLTLKEIQNNEIQELNPYFYGILSQFLGKLKIEEYDGIEKKTKNQLADLFSSLTSLLINSRLEKISKGKKFNRASLLDEEKFIIDSNQEMNERKDLIIQSIINGKSKLVESISNDYKTKPVVIRFLKETDQLLCADSEKYGPFKVEDIATLPNEDAQQLISNNIATKIRIEE
jgi:DNA replication factor GINS